MAKNKKNVTLSQDQVAQEGVMLKREKHYVAPSIDELSQTQIDPTIIKLSDSDKQMQLDDTLLPHVASMGPQYISEDNRPTLSYDSKQ